MPVEWRPVQVAFNEGIDQKSDPKQVVAGKLIALQNGYFQTINEIKKRPGYAQLGATLAAGGNALQAYNNELVAMDGKNLLSYSASQLALNVKGTKVTIDLSTQSVVSNSYQQSVPDSAYDSATGLYVFAYEDTRGGVYYTVVDSVTGQTIVNSTQVLSTGFQPKVKLIGTHFVIFLGDSSSHNLKYATISTATPTVISALSNFATDFNNTTPLYDACVLGTKIYVAWDSSTATTIGLQTIDSSLSLSGETTVSGQNADQAITIFPDTVNNQVWVAFANSSHAVKYFVRSSTLTSVLAITAIETASTTVRNITGIASTGSGSVFYAIVGSTNENTFIRTSNLTSGGAVSGTATLIRSLGLASKAFSQGSVTYFLTTHDSTLQPTYFLINSSGVVVTKIALSLGGGLTAKSILPEVNSISSNNWQFPYQLKGTLEALNGGVFSTLGISSASINYAGRMESEVIGGVLNTSGGISTMYDGANVVEQNFNVYPEAISTAVTQSAGQLGPGTSTSSINQVQYAATYEWTDNQGQIHRSAPSVAQTVQYPAATAIEFTGHTSSGLATITNIPSTAGMAAGMFVYIFDYILSAGHWPTFFTNGTTIVSVDSATQITVANTITSTQTGFSFLASTIPATLIAITGQTVGSATTTLDHNPGSTIGAGQVLLIPTAQLGTIPAGTYIKTWDSGSQTAVLSNVYQQGGPATIPFYTLDTTKISVTVDTLRVTDKSNVSIVLYRTLNNGTVFYRVTSLTSPTANDKTVDSVTIDDTTGDGVLQGNQQLYTTGGEVNNSSPPSLSIVTQYKSRMIGIPSENRSQWWYSKQVIPGSPVEFSTNFVQNMEQKIKSIQLILPMDDKLVFWGPLTIYYIGGDGPTPAGTNNDFSEPIQVPTDQGCSNKKSGVVTPVGCFYQSTGGGIYLLDRSLQVSYIGADVEGLTTGRTVTSAKITPNFTQIRFTLDNGTALVYDYFSKQWSTFTNISALDATIFQNLYTYISSGGVVNQETPGTFTDNGSFIQLSLTSGWINFAGVQGYQRTRRLMLLGDYKSPHTLQVNVAYEFASSFTQHASEVVSSPITPYQYRVPLNRQKTESIQIQIQDSQSSNFGEGLSLSNIAFEVGVKKGLDKLPAAQTFG